MSGFKDHFSSASGRYAAYRPDYPAALFAWLADLCSERDTAWDCATGNGQAALLCRSGARAESGWRGRPVGLRPHGAAGRDGRAVPAPLWRNRRPVLAAERALIDNAYRSLDFPFPEITVPAFNIAVEWALPRLLDYLSTWSAVKRYQAAQGRDPLPALLKELAPAWGNPDAARRLQWPLFLRVGRL